MINASAVCPCIFKRSGPPLASPILIHCTFATELLRVWRCCLQLLPFCAFQVHYILNMIGSPESLCVCLCVCLHVFFVNREHRQPHSILWANYCCSDYQCERVTSGHHSFQTTRTLCGWYKTFLFFFFCSDLPADSACFVQMSFTDFKGLVFFSFLISYRVMANALLLYCMSPNFLLIAKKEKRKQKTSSWTCPFIRWPVACQACPQQRSICTGHPCRRFITTCIVINLLLEGDL